MFNISQRTREVLETLSGDRKRTNLLKKAEQKFIAVLVQRIPGWITSDMLTGVGLFGSAVVSASFILADYVKREFLLLGVLGFIISWFGDSLDGRLAYFRKKPRKLYGFTLDITIDWISIILIGCGFIVYVEGPWELIGYAFVIMYGWELIIALMRYRITGVYSIDSGKLGPTEARIMISLIMIAEVIFPRSINYSALGITLVLFIINIIDTRKLLIVADEIDTRNNNK